MCVKEWDLKVQKQELQLQDRRMVHLLPVQRNSKLHIGQSDMK